MSPLCSSYEKFSSPKLILALSQCRPPILISYVHLTKLQQVVNFQRLHILITSLVSLIAAACAARVEEGECLGTHNFMHMQLAAHLRTD